MEFNGVVLSDEQLYFFREQLARNKSYNYSIVWEIPDLVIDDERLTKLVARWFVSTKKDLRLYLEQRVFSHVRERYGCPLR